MKRYILFLASSVLLLGSCTSIFNARTKSKIISADKDAEIIVEKGGNSYSSGIISQKGKDSISCTLFNSTDCYLVRIEKPGYRPGQQLLVPTKFNPGRILDFIIPFTCSIVGITLLGDGSDETNLAVGLPMVLGGAAGLIGGFAKIGRGKIYEKRYLLKPLVPFPMADSTSIHLRIDKVDVDVPSSEYTWTNYESLKTYTSKVPINSGQSKENLLLQDIDLKDEMNMFLKKCGYLDTTSSLLFSAISKADVWCKILKIHEVHVNEYMFIEMTTELSFNNPVDGSVIFSKIISATSTWDVRSSGEKDNALRNCVEDCLESSFIEFISKPEVISGLNNFKKEHIDLSRTWDTLNLTAKGGYSASLEQSVNACVTVKTAKGHGSGFIVSDNGFIITNYHVVGEDTSEVTIIMNDGKKIKGHVVRIAPEYDLALLKVESGTQLVPIRINSLSLAGIGAEIYAIGTPKDISLGQTLTKGIISGKRNVENKILLQSDASVNEGNSGGPLITKDNLVVGIVNSKILGFGVEGVSFAIPSIYIAEALKVLQK
jgi:S1-C subfamily serine protease